VGPTEPSAKDRPDCSCLGSYSCPQCVLSVDGLASLQRDPPEAWVRVTALEGTSKTGSLERVAGFKPLKEQSVLS
jgi:hypothetical protein